MPERDGGSDKKFQVCGWLLFVLSAVFFIAASIRSGDVVGLIGGLLFFVACFVFLIPFLPEKPMKYWRNGNSLLRLKKSQVLFTKIFYRNEK